MIGFTSVALAAIPTLELHAGPTAYIHQSPTHLGLGVGGQLGVRAYWVPVTLGVDVSVGRLQLATSRWVVQLGTDLRGAQRTYRPWVGVELAAVGGAYEIRTNPHPDPSSGPPLAVGVAVEPMVFVHGSWRWSFVEGSLGVPLEGRGVAASVTPISAGRTF